MTKKIVLILFCLGFLVAIKTGVLAVKTHPEAKKELDALSVLTDNVKNAVPVGACLTTSFPKKEPMLGIGIFKYYLFPVKIKDEWINGYNKTSPKCNGVYFIDLSKGELEVLKEPFLPQTVLRSQAHPITIFIKFIAFNGVVFTIGLFVFFSFFPKGIPIGLFGTLSTCFLLGFALLTGIFWILALCRVVLSVFWVGTGILLVLLGAYLFMKKRGGSPVLSWNLKNTSFMEIVMLLVVAVLAVFYVLSAISFPVMIWDEVFIWLLKAKMFFVEQGLSFDYTEYINNYYPVMWPLNIALQYVFMGGMYDQVAKWTSALAFICLLGQLRIISVCLGLNRFFSMVALCIFLVCFNHWTFLTALPENIYIAFMAMSVAFCMLWVDKKNISYLLIALIALWALSGIKFEGFLTGIFMFAAYILSSPNLFKIRREYFLGLLFLTTVFVFLGWFFWLTIQGIPFHIFHLQGSFSFHNLGMLFYVLKDLIGGNAGVFLAVLIVFLWASIRTRWTQSQKLLLFFCCELILFSLFAGVCWPEKEFELYYPEVLTRLFARVACFLVILWFSRVFQSKVIGDEKMYEY